MSRAHTEQPTVLERLRHVHGVTWEWREGTDERARAGSTREMGVIAQDVQAVFPAAVRTDADGKLEVDYAGLLAAVIESVKELADRVERLESGSDDS